MLYAELRGNRKIIHARKASPYGDYRCPTCKAEVFLKAGEIYVAHFAHMPGQGKPECDEYHPSDDLRIQWQTPTPEAPPQTVDGLILSIELEPSLAAQHGARHWGLRLTVPKSYDMRGEIRIDLGGADVRRVSLASLSLEAKTYRANPDAVDFGAVWVSPEVRPAYRKAVEYRISGLSPTVATMFASVPQKLKPQCRLLRWGESYYLVLRSDKPITLPSSLLQHSLADNRGWSCRLITLPDTPDSEIATALEQACDVKIAPARREWALIYPPAYAIHDDGNLQIPSASPFLISIKPVEVGDGRITCVLGEQSQSYQLSRAERHVVELSVGRQTSLRPIHLAWDGTPLNSFVAVRYPDPSSEPSITLEFRKAQSKTTAQLHRASCQASLMRVRIGDEQLSGMHAYASLHGKLLFRKPKDFEWEIEELRFSAIDGVGASVPAVQINRINELLKDASLEVGLDFGHHGQFFSKPILLVANRSGQYHLPRDLRQRIEWLCKASGAFVDEQRRPVGKLDALALIRHFASLKAPVILLPIRRAIQRELRRNGVTP